MAPLDASPAAQGCPSGLEPASTDVDTVAVDPSPFVRGADDAASLELMVRGAKCAGCMKKIERGVGELDGVDEARLNLSTGKLTVRFDAARATPKRFIERLNALGYAAAPFDPDAVLAEDDAHGRKLLICLAVAGFAAANVMLLSVSVWSGAEMSATTRDLFHWISGLIAIPAALFAGRPFFESAVTALKARRANMDVPISLAVLLALGLSVYETAVGGADAYFDAAVTLLFFLLIGRYLDHLMRRRARAAARSLLALQATTATRLDPVLGPVAVAAKDVRPGDQLLLAPGDRAPVDVTIEAGASDVDMSLATGESAPQAATPSVSLPAGVRNLTGALTVRADAAAADSFLAELARLIETGEQAKTRYIRLADRAAALYVPIVHGVAAATFVGWFIATGDVRTAATAAIALLIITCPCALGLAVPVVQVVATSRLFRAGVLVKSGDALERLAAVDHAVFDKTGTLTRGRLALAPDSPHTPADIAAVAPLARASRHPVARALTDAAGPGPVAVDVIEHAGLGVEGLVDGVRVRLGRAEWVGAPSSDETGAFDAGPQVWAQVGDAAPVRFTFVDDPRTDAAQTLRALTAAGVTVEAVSGDRPGAVAALANRIGLTTWRADAAPQDKADRLAELAAEGRTVMMVGDGLNDAPALAAAHVSLSPGAAAEASQHASDFVFQGDGLSPVVTALTVARAAKRRILENFGFAVVYNMIAAPLAAAGFVTPLVAAIAMSSSSIIVIANALRLARADRPAQPGSP